MISRTCEHPGTCSTLRLLAPGFWLLAPLLELLPNSTCLCGSSDIRNRLQTVRGYWSCMATTSNEPQANEPAHRFIETNGIRMHVVEQGRGPTVLLCHGFPESWYSWRHQLGFLAAAGFNVVAPDMRGYGQTDRPESIDQYSLLHLVGDLVGLLDELGTETAVIVGHDWGPPLPGTRRYCDPTVSGAWLD